MTSGLLNLIGNALAIIYQIILFLKQQYYISIGKQIEENIILKKEVQVIDDQNVILANTAINSNTVATDLKNGTF